MKRIICEIAALAVVSCPLSAHAAENPLDPESWPRSYQVGDDDVAIYQPQILEWSEYRHLKANAAIAVKLNGAKEPAFGIATFEADTVADFDGNSVRIGTRTFNGFKFPDLDASASAAATEIVRSVLTPDALLEIPLDSMLAAVDRADTTGGDTAVSLDPPPIFRSESPAVLVVFIGEPKLEAVTKDDPSLMFVANTNWDVLFDSASASYYLLAGSQWLTTRDPAAGPWSAAGSLPESFEGIPDDANWADVKARSMILPGATSSPKVFVSYQPAEIIETQGAPQLSPIPAADLMYVVNTEDDVFFQASDKSFYFLTAGRWFRAASLDGPWTAATTDLPESFRDIPETHPKATVLVSVPGTAEADEAVIRASIPQTATVNRSSTHLTVSYDGEPRFKPVTGADEVQVAVNTGNDVFLVSKQYYCCHQGVWFEAPKATGTWIVCDKVPAAIYTIPPQSPKYNVTHVHVYESTPTTVQVGVTSGYSGAYVANGLVMFGLGYWIASELADDHHHHYYPSPCWYGYGCGAHYRHGHGYCARGGYAYGPYGGAGYAAAYNPATGTYARGAYAYGPRGAVAGKAAYNPWTNTAAGRVGGVTPYGSWGRSAVVRDDEWIRSAHRSNWQGSVRAVETSKGGAAVRVDRRYGSDGFVGKTGEGDVYAGKDGNLYRKTEDGWQKRQDGGWQSAPDLDRPTNPGPRPGQPGVRPPDPNPRPGQPGIRPPDQNPRPGQPGIRPPDQNPRPGQPGIRPPDPNPRPGQPGIRPPDPNPRPGQPGTRPTDPRAKPAPVTTQPTRGGYQNRQSTPSQLDRDSYSRSRAGSGSRTSRSSGRTGRR